MIILPNAGAKSRPRSSCLKYILYKNSAESDQMPYSAASDRILHCLPMLNTMNARLIS